MSNRSSRRNEQGERAETIADRTIAEKSPELNKNRSHLIEKHSFMTEFIVGKLKQCISMY